MKKFVFLISALYLAFSLPLFGAGVEENTRQLAYESLRTAVIADDTPLDGTTTGYTYQFSDKPATAKGVETTHNRVEIIIYGIDANTADGNDATVNFKIWAWRERGPARLVYSGTATLGTAKASSTEYYTDTISGTSYWITSVEVIDADGSNRAASLAFDLQGHKYLHFEVDIPATASNPVSSVSAEVAGW